MEGEWVYNAVNLVLKTEAAFWKLLEWFGNGLQRVAIEV